MFDKNEVQQKWFSNKKSFEAFLYAMDIAKKLHNLQEKGAIIIGKHGLFKTDGEWTVDLNPKRPCVGFKHNGCMVGYAGMCFDDDDKHGYPKKKFAIISKEFLMSCHKMFKNSLWINNKIIT